MTRDLTTDIDVYTRAIEEFNIEIARLRQNNENFGGYLMIQSVGRNKMKFDIGTKQDYENRKEKKGEILIGGEI